MFVTSASSSSSSSGSSSCYPVENLSALSAPLTPVFVSTANFLAVKSVGACVSDCGSGQHADIDGNCVDDAHCVGHCPKSTYVAVVESSRLLFYLPRQC